MSLDDKTHAEVAAVLHTLCEYVVKNRFRRYGNQYTQAPVRNALIMLCKLTGKSHSGYDWLDIVDILNGDQP